MKYNLKITKIEIKNLYLSGKTLQEIGDIAGCTHKNISNHLKRMNVIIRNQEEAQRKYKLIQEYFRNIDDEYKAYFLGFLFADGYNNELKNQISIRLHKKDIDILYIFRDLIYPNKDRGIKLYQDKYVDLSINSKIMSNDLANIGCIQNKSLKLIFPDIQKEYQSHFMRGYFDGDGCISLRQENQLNLTGTYSFLTTFQNILCNNLNITKTIFSKRRKETGCYTMHYKGTNNCIKILNFLYKDCNISLKRKNSLYLSILS